MAHVSRSAVLALITGYAGTGKSAMLSVAYDGWEQAGYRVQGAALSGIAAENLEGSSGISSRTIASLEHQWAQGREDLGTEDVLVIGVKNGSLGTVESVAPARMAVMLDDGRAVAFDVMLLADLFNRIGWKAITVLCQTERRFRPRRLRIRRTN